MSFRLFFCVFANTRQAARSRRPAQGREAQKMMRPNAQSRFVGAILWNNYSDIRQVSGEITKKSFATGVDYCQNFSVSENF